MRAFYIAVALIAAVAGAGGIRANEIGAGPTGIDPLVAGPATPRGVVLGSSGIRHAPNSWGRGAGLRKPYEPEQARDNTVQLAQLFPNVAAPEATTGNPSIPPLTWVGLLMIPNPTQNDPNSATICTAQFIKPNVLLTAAHCVKDLPSNPTGPWPDPTKGVFWLQYQNDSGRGPFNIVCAATNPLWAYPSNYKSLPAAQQNAALPIAAQHDFAMILVDKNSPTGVMPYALDWKGKVTSAMRVGYPVDILDAAIVQQVAGEVFFSNAIPMGSNSQPGLVVHWGPGVEATQGMSGGAWIVGLDPNNPDNSNILVAVSSFESSAFPGASFGAYLTATEFNPLLTFVSNGCK
jgi:hypothetical protein